MKTETLGAAVVCFFIGWTFGLAIAYGHCRDVVQGYASPSWPTTPGTVDKSKFRYDMHNTPVMNFSYHFTVDGKTYDGFRIGYLEDDDEEIGYYPVGKHVLVHYLPSNPWTCVIEPGVSEKTWVGLFIGLIMFAGLGIIIPVCVVRKAML